MIDVGAGKENADAKLRDALRDNIRLHQTWKVFLGISHDNGYAPEIRSLMTEGHKDKLVLVQSYDDIAANIRELELPVLHIPDLFMEEKLQSYWSPVKSPRSPGAKSLPDVTSPWPSLTTLAAIEDTTTQNQTQPRTPGKPLDKLIPPPCHRFYLLQYCAAGPSCKFSHEWQLYEDDLTELAKLAKVLPCSTLSNKGICLFRDKCVFGHVCPQGPTCYRLKQGRCRYKGCMHGE